MNVLEIVNRGCDIIGIPRLASLVDADVTDTVSRQIVGYFYDVHYFLRNQRIFIQQKRTHIFDLEADRKFYQLPRDFFAALLATQYDDTTKFPLLGPLTDSQFDLREYGLAGFTPIPAFRIFGPDNNPNDQGGQFQVWPTPTAPGDTLSFEYQSRNLFQPPPWTPDTAVLEGQYYNASGNIYIVTQDGTTAEILAPTGKDTEAIMNGSAMFLYQPQAYETIILNTDTSIFDDDLVLSGFIARYYKGKTQPQAVDAQNDFKMKIDSARNRYYGSFRGSLSRFKRYRYSGINPQGNWQL